MTTMSICDARPATAGRAMFTGRPFAPDIDAGTARHTSASESALVLDQRGCVRACTESARQLFGHPRDEMIDTPVRSLIPRLPLREDTPGYNLAYVLFAFPHERWHAFEGRDAAGRKVLLDVFIRVTSHDGRQAFVVALR